MEYEQDKDNLFWNILNYIVDINFFVDIIINFLTPIINERGYINTNNKDIAYKYFKTWFFIDLISVLPLEICTLFLKNVNED